MTQGEVFVGAEALEPSTDVDLMAAFGEGGAIFIGKEIASNAEITAVVATGETELGGGIGGRAASDNDGTEWEAAEETGFAGCGSAGSGFTREEVGGAGKTDTGGVEKVWREDVGLFDAGDLFAEGFGVGTEEVSAGGSEIGAIVDGVDDVESVFFREDVIEARGAEVIANGLERIIEGFGDASEIRSAGAGRGP